MNNHINAATTEIAISATAEMESGKVITLKLTYDLSINSELGNGISLSRWEWTTREGDRENVGISEIEHRAVFAGILASIREKALIVFPMTGAENAMAEAMRTTEPHSCDCYNY